MVEDIALLPVGINELDYIIIDLLDIATLGRLAQTCGIYAATIMDLASWKEAKKHISSQSSPMVDGCAIYFPSSWKALNRKTTEVSGYIRSNGTYVNSYCRSSGHSSSKVVVSGHYKNNGTYVGGYVRSAPHTAPQIHVSGYTRSNGTYVHGYSRHR